MAYRCWYSVDDENLIEDFNRGMRLKQLCEVYERSEQSIVSRLVKLNKLANIGRSYYPVSDKVWHTF